MASPVYKRVIWNAPERFSDEKIKQMADNYYATQYLYQRSPQGIMGIVRSETPILDGDIDYVTLSLTLGVTAGRAYRIKMVNNNVVWGFSNGVQSQLRINGSVVIEKYIQGRAAPGGSLSGFVWDAPYALEYIYLCTQSNTSLVVDHNLHATLGFGPFIYWKVVASEIAFLDSQFAITQAGDYYIIVEDIGVIDY